MSDNRSKMLEFIDGLKDIEAKILEEASKIPYKVVSIPSEILDPSEILEDDDL